MERGLHLKVIQDLLGHSQISVTADTYAHVAAPQRREAADQMQAALVPASAQMSACVGVKTGVKSPALTPSEVEFLRNQAERVVSPLGIEPRTNRLRVCCSTN